LVTLCAAVPAILRAIDRLTLDVMAQREAFSERHGFRPNDAPITIRTDAPEDLRGVVVDIAYESGYSPSPLRTLVCRVLRKRADPNNWTEYPNINDEVRWFLDHAEWYEVYDVIEAIAEALTASAAKSRSTIDSSDAKRFESEINKYFRRAGIGWQLIRGELQVRGSDAFEQTIRSGGRALRRTGRETAADELEEALRDLSRRPDADVTGAVQHSVAAVECAARDFTGDTKATLGELIKRNPDFLPAPLDVAVSKIWGYASERARHLREGGAPSMEDAQLVVGFAATICNYISSRS
jgi:hypothetical protein